MRKRVADSKVLETHFTSEVEHDWDQCLATFKGTPAFTRSSHAGQIHEGAEAVRAYHSGTAHGVPDQRHENVRMHVAMIYVPSSPSSNSIGTNTGRS